MVLKLSGFFQIISHFSEGVKTVRIFPDHIPFSWQFQNSLDFSGSFPIFRIVSQPSKISQIISHFPDSPEWTMKNEQILKWIGRIWWFHPPKNAWFAWLATKARITTRQMCHLNQLCAPRHDGRNGKSSGPGLLVPLRLKHYWNSFNPGPILNEPTKADNFYFQTFTMH